MHIKLHEILVFIAHTFYADFLDFVIGLNFEIICFKNLAFAVFDHIVLLTKNYFNVNEKLCKRRRQTI